jgi:hypothetical protein
MINTIVSVSIHIHGPSIYHCDQSGDSATVRLGTGYDACLTANAENFLQLAKVCKEAARRIALKNIEKVEKQFDREFAEQFPET